MGIKISQAGVSVPLAADYQFVFNSDWPSLQIGFDTTVNLPISGDITIAHNLGFPPLTMGWLLLNGVNIGRIFAFSQNFDESDQNGVSLTFDSQNIYLNNLFLDTSQNYSINIKCYNVDISKSANYTLPKQPFIKVPYDPTTGIKVVKYNKNISSTDLRDFILHSRAQSPALLAVVTAVSPDVAFYENPVGYIPWTLAFYKTSNIWQGLSAGSQQSGALFRLGANLSFNNISVKNGGILASTLAGDNLSLVVLRDPLVVPNLTQVTYNG